MPFLLDADTASLAFAGNLRVLARIRQEASANVWLSSVTAEELLRGALNLISRNSATDGLPVAHDFLARLLGWMSSNQIHPYDAEAARVFASFSAQVKRAGTQDCRIAASAIAQGWVVVTANRKDFSKIPGVRFEDWSR